MELFDLEFYKVLLKNIQNNYTITDYGDVYCNNNKKSLLIRHDIDVSLYDALELAKIEAEFNIKSTYFIWIKSPFYNALSIENQKNLFKIIELGHDIALHFDPTEIHEKDFEKAVSFEIKILENTIQKKLTAISFHQPYASLIRSENKYIANLPQVYSKEIFDTYEYIADSNCKWSKPIKKLLDGEFDKVQLLVHPEWWVNAEVENRYRVLKSISKNRMRDEMYHLSLSGLFNGK
ncbi:hypothetical protein [Arcobacter caeni]|uniref:NodB homology domain-containing protein n=1 Tax=Arcobacter caeni TaxID=1912877 RepID=A0A363CXG6_9BACT|nr:hypothetical protein [Arcobacter caeni]PUE63764.1 hypothetical protein B0174_09455 [Arcobacter caeni]